MMSRNLHSSLDHVAVASPYDTAIHNHLTDTAIVGVWLNLLLHSTEVSKPERLLNVHD